MTDEKENGSGPQIQRRTVWVELPKEYAGFKAEIWVNAPTKLWMELESGDEKRALDAAAKLVLAHNGWLDFDGHEYPQPSDHQFWEDVPTELAACVFAAMQTEMQTLPNSVAPRRRRSRRG